MIDPFSLRWTGSISHSSILKVNWVAKLPQTKKKVLNSVQTSLEGTWIKIRIEADQSDIKCDPTCQHVTNEKGAHVFLN